MLRGIHAPCRFARTSGPSKKRFRPRYPPSKKCGTPWLIRSWRMGKDADPLVTRGIGGLRGSLVTEFMGQEYCIDPVMYEGSPCSDLHFHTGSNRPLLHNKNESNSRCRALLQCRVFTNFLSVPSYTIELPRTIFYLSRLGVLYFGM